jgi:SAM-dependent methyltransferase
MAFLQQFDSVVTHGENDNFRNKFVSGWLQSLIPGKILDVGAGLLPFKDIAQLHGHIYRSHDFEKYSPDYKMPGLVEPEYFMQSHDYVSDIADLPKNEFDYVLCTEVLEHVPDPVVAINSAMSALKIGGIALFTVPLRSQIHQAPYFFSAGLSPFWFDYHSKLNGWEQLEVLLVGDQLDSLVNEVPAIMNNLSVWRWNLGSLLRNMLIGYFKFARKWYSGELKSSGGLGVYAILQRVK